MNTIQGGSFRLSAVIDASILDTVLKAMSKQVKLLALVVFLVNCPRLFSAEFVYVIDTSASMKVHRSAAKDRLLQDIKKHLSADSTVVQAGDHIHVWSFNGDVLERLEIEFKPASAAAILKEIESKLKKVKTEGRRTSLARPIIRALERFLAAEYGRLNVFIYTDGKDHLAQDDIEHILRVYNHSFKIGQRLANAYLIHFGTDELPKDTQNLVATLGGRVIPSVAKLDIDIGQTVISSVSATPEPPTPVKTTVVRVTPQSIELSLPPTADTVKVIPVDFNVAPPQPGLSIGMALEMQSLPEGMTVSTVSDRLATEGRQSIALAIRNAQPGVYEGKIILSAPAEAAEVHPQEVPVRIDVLRPQPEQIRVEFYPDPLPQMKFTTGPDWHRVTGLGMVLVYPESVAATQVLFHWEAPSGVELRIVPGGNPTNALAAGQLVPVSAIGRVAVFDIRQSSGQIDSTAQTGTLSLQIPSLGGANVEGASSVAIPFEFNPAFEVRIETRDIPLGELSRDVKTVKRSMAIQTKGNIEGKKLRVMKQGQSLAAIDVLPNEIALKSGAMSVELEFSGFDAQPAGPIQGTILVVPDGISSSNLAPYTVAIRGTILQPPKLTAQVENSMVAGEPMVIRAQFESGDKGATVVATVQLPNSGEPVEMNLVDTGFPDHGDLKEGDGVYSGIFKETSDIGTYRITVVAKRPAVQSAPLTATIYFRAPTSPLIGRIVNRKQGGQGEFVELSCPIQSDYPGEIGIVAEPIGMDAALNTFVATKRLKRGDNTVEFVVGLSQESRPGIFKYHVDLVTDPVHAATVRIPVQLEVRVLSFFQYFIRLSAVTLGVAFAVLLAFFGPWRKSPSRYATRSTVTEAMRAQDQEPIDYR